MIQLLVLASVLLAAGTALPVPEPQGFPLVYGVSPPEAYAAAALGSRVPAYGTQWTYGSYPLGQYGYSGYGYGGYGYPHRY